MDVFFCPHKSHGVLPTMFYPIGPIPSSFSCVSPVWCQGAQLAADRRQLLKKIQEKKAQLQKQQDETLFLVWPWTDFELPAMYSNNSSNHHATIDFFPIKKGKHLTQNHSYEITAGLIDWESSDQTALLPRKDAAAAMTPSTSAKQAPASSAKKGKWWGGVASG